MLKERIADKLGAYFENSEYFLVDIKSTPQEKIMIFIDGIVNVTIEKCVEVSRMLEEFLEEEKLVGDKYTLEVSSPGMDQPFKVFRQYEKSIGKGLEVLKKDGIKLEGILREVNEDRISLLVEKKKKGKVIESNVAVVPFEEIKATKQLITFK
ncbi:MAG: ribosome assembly cofactor RimP [Bacteroidetes bacterium]|nr:ribosome assembly cofactor RimP [Bacteroidota bacterium]